MRLTGKKEWKGPGEPIEGLMRAEPVTTKPD
jgi:hypothetical protein